MFKQDKLLNFSKFILCRKKKKQRLINFCIDCIVQKVPVFSFTKRKRFVLYFQSITVV